MPDKKTISRSTLLGIGDSRPDPSGNHDQAVVKLPAYVHYAGDAQQPASVKGSPSGRSGWKDADGQSTPYAH